ncbi:MAG: signal recognition particle-docking protein FtsY [Proteobacteria bacterium]|uniref:Signal recognition particle receptor FtsY n=1 Tax=Candidatus Avisuccinivibrio stercorigallinarum TaxID=2840704 RepID=A0A9D9DB10_9GAMM|nr:signal recognition particle-docking protein FtsY [Candidatus Avisuccinivibrio stercorigallinarum]
MEEVKHPAAEVKIVTVPEPKADKAAKLKAEPEVKAEEPEAEPVKAEPVKATEPAAPAAQADDAAKVRKAARKSKRAAKKAAAKAQESAAQAAETASAPAAEAAVEAKDESKAAEVPAPAAEIQAAEPAVPVEAKQAAQAAEAEAVPQTEAAAEADAAENAEQPEGETAKGEKAADAADEAEPQAEAKAEVCETFFSRLKKTRENLALGVSAFFKGRVIDEELYEDLETSLLTADLGVETTEFVIEKLREEAKLRELHDASLLKKRLQQILVDLLKPCEQELVVTDKKPFVILMVGVNGAGKTTTIGKLARKYKDQGLKVMLAAGDTFRAAAVEQLKEWGKRADVPVISQPTGSDSASVLFDALNAAKARNMDVLICDTAGRLQNKSQLMEELKKIVRVMKKLDPEVPHEVLLVLDAATGQNAVSQTKIFKEAVDVSGICLTKLDGTAKGGVIFALADKFKLPLRFVGLGEKAEDLRPFEAEVFVDALLRGE